MAKGVLWKLQTVQAVVKTIDCSPQTVSKALLLKTTPIQLIEHGEVKLVPSYSLHLYILVCLVQEGILYATKGETNISQVTNPLIYNNVLPTRYVSSMVAQSLWE